MPSILQGPTTVTYAGAAGTTLAFPGACTPGSKIVILATQENQAGTFAISDPTNGTYANDSTGAAGNGLAGSGAATIRSVDNTASTALTITLTLGASSSGTLTLVELDDAELDAATSGLGGTATAFTGSLTSAANSLALAVGVLYPAGAVVDAGYTAAFAEVGISKAYHFGEYDEDVGAAGLKTVTFGLGTPDNWSLAFATYKTPGGGPVYSLAWIRA